MGTERLQPITPEPVQRKRAGPSPLPDALQSGVESLSGIALGDVAVHYNSPEPSKVDALAYAQGNSIHIAPGQEEHLPHEAWHLVQQAQGRVAPSTKIKRGRFLNLDSSLEREADVMGARASRIGCSGASPRPVTASAQPRIKANVVQLMKGPKGKTTVEITTLDELNAFLKEQGFGFQVDTGCFEDDPSKAALDKAIAASPLSLVKGTKLAAITGDLKGRLVKPAAVPKGKGKGAAPVVAEPEIDPKQVRREAAEKLKPVKPLKQDGYYFGGGDKELHVHVVGGGFHLKGAGGDRKNIHVNGKLCVGPLKEARQLIEEHAKAGILNAAIDRALLDAGEELDDY